MLQHLSSPIHHSFEGPFRLHFQLHYWASRVQDSSNILILRFLVRFSNILPIIASGFFILGLKVLHNAI